MSARDNSKERFTDLFNENKHRVYDYACRMLGDRDTAGDITQEAFIRLYDNLNNGRAEIKSPRNWLFIIARNLCLNKIRDTRNVVNLENALGMDELKYSDINPQHLQLNKAMNNLDTEFREALILKEYQGFSYVEISSIMGKSLPAVRSLLHKARIALRENFKKIDAGR